MLIFDNEQEDRKFASAELQRERLSSSATSMVSQRAQSYHSTPAGQVSGAAFSERLHRSALNSLGQSQPLGRDTTTTTKPPKGTISRCPVGDYYDEIKQACVRGPSQAESGLKPGLQELSPHIAVKVPATYSQNAATYSQNAADFSTATKIPAPAPVVPSTPKPVSVVSAGPTPPMPAYAQESLVTFNPETPEGFLDKSLIGGFKVKHAIIGTGVLGAGILALRVLR